MLYNPHGAEPITAVVVMSLRNARFTPPRNRGVDNHELPFVRFGRIHRRSVDHSCVSALATGETSKLVTEVFTAERSRSIADNGIADLRLQFVSIYRGGVLVFDKLGRAMESTQLQKTIEIWLAMATINSRERTLLATRQGSRRFEVGPPGGSYSHRREGSPKTAPIARSGQTSR